MGIYNMDNHVILKEKKVKQHLLIIHHYLISGAFVLPFVLMLFLLGLPLMFMELSFGQFAGLGPAVVFERFCPLFHGE